MKKVTIVKYWVFLAILFFHQSIFSNVIWPALFVASGIASFPIIISSIAIEAMFFYWLLKNISIDKAFWMSVVGNIASTLVGTAITALLALPVTYGFYSILGEISPNVDFAIEVIFMYFGSCLIELLTINKVFGYPAKQLWISIFAGNFATYALAAIFYYRYL